MDGIFCMSRVGRIGEEEFCFGHGRAKGRKDCSMAAISGNKKKIMELTTHLSSSYLGISLTTQQAQNTNMKIDHGHEQHFPSRMTYRTLA